jgi:AGCS family alanine or glycine:cation symporter
VIVLGSLKRIARFAELIVPVTGIAFILVALAITLMNLSAVTAMLYGIITSAFGL